VNGIAAKEVFLKRRIGHRRVFVTGMAHFDHTFKLADSAKPISMSNSKLVLFATENLPFAETLQMMKPVAEFVLRTPYIRMVVRPHPRENPNTYLDFIRSLNSDRVVLDTTTSLLDLLSAADVCVTGFSNVAVEAMIMNKPVVCMNVTKRPDILGYVTEKAALGVVNLDEAATTLRLALYDEKTKASLARGRAGFLRKRFYRADGKASDRIASLIGRLANRHG
jgi:UDP-N-acetylglucosamine 2-epimerase